MVPRTGTEHSSLRIGLILLLSGAAALLWLWLQPMGPCASDTQIGLLMIALGVPIGAGVLLVRILKRAVGRTFREPLSKRAEYSIEY